MPVTSPDIYRLPLWDRMTTFGWELKEDDFWFRCSPAAFPFRPQGWKIHLSTSLANAQDLLETASRLLVDEEVAFKFAKSPEQVKALLSHRFDRGGGGKFITIYPRDDEQFRRLVPLLDSGTERFSGPAILSDTRFTPDSVVHYRYGAITGDRPVHRNEGYFEVPLVSPSGEWEDDPRNAWFSPPAWAVDPFARPEATITAEPIMLNGRYEVVEAIRHSNRGGVYRAVDSITGSSVIIKEARPFIGPEDDGTDMTDRLHHEYAMLLRFRDRSGLLPQPVDFFNEGGHSFLVESMHPGVDARNWWRTRVPTDVAERERITGLFVTQLKDLVSTVHGDGIVLRDLTPGNIMIDGEAVSLIDPEYFAEEGSPVAPAFTFGYAPLSTIRTRGIAPAQGDGYNLAMCIVFLTTGVEPLILTPATSDETAGGLLDDWLTLLFETHPSATAYEVEVRRLLGRPSPPARVAALASGHHQVDAEGLFEQPLREAVDQLIAVDWDEVERDGLTPWRPDDSGTATGDFGSVQSGFGGAVQVLADLMSTPLRSDDIEACLRNASRWMARAVRGRNGRTLPGLYFGRTGTAWALNSASIALDDPDLADHARALLLSAPVNWGNPDMTHGLAGVGTAHLAMLRHRHDALVEARARHVAEEVLRAAEVVDGEYIWPIQQTGANIETDQSHLGFAHGVAGMGTFLLDAADYFDDERFRHGADMAARTLVGRAIHRGDGPVDWPIGVLDRDADTREVRWWCSGSGGIGAFLSRHARVTSDSETAALAMGAATACAEDDLLLMPGHCHGISGNAQLFLDVQEFLDPTAFAAEAHRSGRALLVRRIATDDGLTFANDTGNRVSVSYGQGVTGPIAYLSRLLYGTPRPFTWNPS